MKTLADAHAAYVAARDTLNAQVAANEDTGDAVQAVMVARADLVAAELAAATGTPAG